MKNLFNGVLQKIEKLLNLWHYHLETFLMHLIIVRKIPRHVAFIMDGNRRYAREMNIPLPMGHVEGFQMLQRMIRWLYLLRIPEVTVYAFSLENFKRSHSEITILFSLVRNAISHARRHETEYRKYKVRVKVIGRVQMLPKDIRKAIEQIEDETKHNDGFRINIAVAYTSRDDIVGGIRSVCEGVQNNSVVSEEASEETIEKNLLTNQCYPLDILIRTSGETRLSDFLLWESSDSMLYFLPKHWPSVILWDLIKVFLHFQRHSGNLVTKCGVKVSDVIDESQYVKRATDYLDKHQSVQRAVYLLDNYKRYMKVRKAKGEI